MYTIAVTVFKFDYSALLPKCLFSNTRCGHIQLSLRDCKSLSNTAKQPE